MLSVLVYGRNDAYGENYHRRVAVSLNCIAEILAPGADEIIFVDYATPNTAATLIEAIADTLTQRASALIRVIRVRPEFHAAIKHVHPEPLPVYEAVARNIGLRRIKPGQSWVLSTNSDMLFVPTFPQADLHEFLRQLKPGLFHLRRYEVPESVWHNFRRSDPAAIFDDLVEYAAVLNLDYFAVTNQDALFDNPGDFQLAPAAAMTEIHGFDEAMQSGWHIDSNMSARLKLRYGAIGDATPFFKGFHLTHTRTATPKHLSSAAVDEVRAYVRAVHDAAVPAQAASWGAPHIAFEEFVTAHSPSARFIKALYAARMEHTSAAALLDERNKLVIDRTPESYLAMNFLNMVHHQGPAAKIGVCVASANLLAAFLEVAGQFFASAEIFAPAELTHGCGAEASMPGARLHAVSTSEFCGLPDVFIVSGESGFKGGGGASPQARIAFTKTFEALVRAERLAIGVGAARRIFYIHGADNIARGEFEFSTTPNVIGVKIGWVIEDRHFGVNADRVFLGKLIGRLTARGGASDEDWQVAAGLRSRIAERLAEAEAEGKPLATLGQKTELLRRIDAGRAKTPAVPLPMHDSLQRRRGLQSRLASTLDWSLPDWRAVATLGYAGSRRTQLAHLDSWVWQRASAQATLAELRLLAPGKSILMVVHMPEIAAFTLAQSGAQVSVIDTGSVLDVSHVGTNWLDIYSSEQVTHDANVSFLPQASALGPRYDAIVILQNSALMKGVDSLARFLSFAEQRLNAGGTLIFSANVKVGAPSGWKILPARALAGHDDFGDAIRRHTPFDYCGAKDFSLDTQSLETLAWIEFSGADSRIKSVFDAAKNGFLSCGVFTFTKTRDAPVNIAPLGSSLHYVWSKHGAMSRKPNLRFLPSWLKLGRGKKPAPTGK